MAGPIITGSLTALVTPFKDGAFDEEAFRAFVQWQIDEGTDDAEEQIEASWRRRLAWQNKKPRRQDVFQHVLNEANAKLAEDFVAEEAEAQKKWKQSPPKVTELLRSWLQGAADETAEERNARCFQVFRCVTARVAVPDVRRCDIAIELGVVEDKDGNVGGPAFACSSSTCFSLLKLPAYEEPAQLERGMMLMLEQSNTKEGAFSTR